MAQGLAAMLLRGVGAAQAGPPLCQDSDGAGGAGRRTPRRRRGESWHTDVGRGVLATEDVSTELGMLSTG